MSEESNVLMFNCVNPNKFNKLDEQSVTEPNLFYDKHSKKIISILDEGIKIFNKRTTNLKQDIPFGLDKKEVSTVVVDKDLKYMIIIMNKAKNETLNNGLIVDLEKVCTTQKIQYDFNYNLGIFFIKRDKLFGNATKKKKTHFCFVFIDRIAFFSINPEKQLVKEISSETFNINTLIIDFSYNIKYKILCCAKNDNSFDFYNLSKKKFYSKNINKSFPFLNVVKKASFFKKFSKIDSHELKRIKDQFSCRDHYTMSQFFLEALYDHLYFIYMKYEDNKIHICRINNLKDIVEVKTIDYVNHNKFSTLQFIDNLIIVHNFLRKNVMVIDIQSKELIINESACVTFPYERNIFVNGEIFEERNNEMKGMIIYNISFNCKKYEELAFDSIERMNSISSKDVITKYDIISNLLRRKNAKDIIVKTLHKLILEQEEFINIVKVFREIVQQFVLTSPSAMTVTRNEISKEEPNQYELPKLIDMFVFHKKATIKQTDIFHFLFRSFESEDLSQKMIHNIIDYMILFYQEMIRNKIAVQPVFCLVLSIFLRRNEDMNSLLNWFSGKVIPDSFEIAEFLLSVSEKKNNFNAKFFAQQGIDMMMRLKKHEQVVEFLLKHDYVQESLRYINRYKKQIKKEYIRKTLMNYVEKIKNCNLYFYLTNLK